MPPDRTDTPASAAIAHGSRSTGGGDRYALGASEAERQRLLALGSVHRRLASDLLEHLAVQPGWRVADIGCGPLGILDLLSDRVGPHGHVVGLDTHADMVRWARQSVAELALQNVRIVHGDAYRSELPRASFDLAHERFLLINLPDPERVVREMAALVRPGGIIALQESDLLTWICVPDHPAWSQLRGHLSAVWEGDVYIGRRLPSLLRDAGLHDILATAHVRLSMPGDRLQRLLLYFIDTARERILDSRTLTATELDRLIEDLLQHLAQPDTIVIDPLIFQASARKARG